MDFYLLALTMKAAYWIMAFLNAAPDTVPVVTQKAIEHVEYFGPFIYKD